MRERDMKIVGRVLAIAGIVAVLSAVGYFGVKRLAVYAYHEFIYPIYNLPSEERVVKQVQKRYPEAVLLGHESYRKETPDMPDGEDDDVFVYSFENKGIEFSVRVYDTDSVMTILSQGDSIRYTSDYWKKVAEYFTVERLCELTGVENNGKLEQRVGGDTISSMWKDRYVQYIYYPEKGEDMEYAAQVFEKFYGEISPYLPEYEPSLLSEIDKRMPIPSRRPKLDVYLLFGVIPENGAKDSADMVRVIPKYKAIDWDRVRSALQDLERGAATADSAA